MAERANQMSRDLDTQTQQLVTEEETKQNIETLFNCKWNFSVRETRCKVSMGGTLLFSLI